MTSEIVANLGLIYGLLPDDTKHLPEPIITINELNTQEQTTMEYQPNLFWFMFKYKYHLQNVSHFV